MSVELCKKIQAVFVARSVRERLELLLDAVIELQNELRPWLLAPTQPGLGAANTRAAQDAGGGGLLEAAHAPRLDMAFTAAKALLGGNAQGGTGRG